MKVYFDNAATTSLDPKVLEAMMPFLTKSYGNPSSIHAFGRETRSAIENARKTVASLLNTSPSQIFFTSAGTEADNTALTGSIKTFGIKHAITSKIEHHAVLHTLEHHEKVGDIQLHFVELDENGSLIMSSLEKLLVQYPGSLVSLMHGNNELGNLNDIEAISNLCKTHNAIFHSDTVQTMGHYQHDLKKLKVDFIVGSAHKFHGPKGVGFLYVGEGIKIQPLLYGGSQERNMRGGTENIVGIIGLAKALEMAYHEMSAHRSHIVSLKQRMKLILTESIADIKFNGTSGDMDKSLYHVLNVSFPVTEISEMLLFNLDIKGIAVSGGSACNSGADIGSHVLRAVYGDDERPAVRFSFSKYNSPLEVDFTVESLKSVFQI
jgi:cysteine desulfurase